MERCDHLQLLPLPELLPCPNPTCRSDRVSYTADAHTGRSITCRACGLSTTQGGQDHQYATWNGLIRLDPGPPKAWLYTSRFGDRELIFNRNTEYAARLREHGYCEAALFVGVPTENASR
jgi:hypothetical protein